MPSQDHDLVVRSAAGEHQDRSMGQLDVPQPRPPSAARLLEMTARDTDQWRSDALAEATEIIAAAREEAGALVRAAQREVDGMMEAARREAAETVDEARAAADDLRAETEKQRLQGETEVARLQQVSADHSQHLRRHLNDMLERLDSVRGQ